MEPPPRNWRPGGYAPPPNKTTSKKPSSKKSATPAPAQAASPPPMYMMLPVFTREMLAAAPPMYMPVYATPQPAPAPVKKTAAPAPASTVVSGSAASTSLSSAKSAPTVKKEKITINGHESSHVKASSHSKKASPPPKNPNAPPKLRAGTNYMFPPEHTQLHIFHKSSKIWREEYVGKHHDFKIITAATNFTVKMVIDNTLAGSESSAKASEWACSEVVEAGNGRWRKGTTIAYTDAKADGSLKAMGWSKKRGDSLPPVWLVIHKL